MLEQINFNFGLTLRISFNYFAHITKKWTYVYDSFSNALFLSLYDTHYFPLHCNTKCGKKIIQLYHVLWHFQLCHILMKVSIAIKQWTSLFEHITSNVYLSILLVFTTFGLIMNYMVWLKFESIQCWLRCISLTVEKWQMVMFAHIFNQVKYWIYLIVECS